MTWLSHHPAGTDWPDDVGGQITPDKAPRFDAGDEHLQELYEDSTRVQGIALLLISAVVAATLIAVIVIRYAGTAP